MGMREEMRAESVEIIRTRELRKQTSCGAEAMEQMEMDGFMQPESLGETVEQAEMDALENETQLGRRLIYYPDEHGDESRIGDRLGEYRVFGDTRPTRSSYDIFADGK